MKLSFALVLTLASGMAVSAAAQSPAAAPAGASKIAVIAFQVAVAQTNEGQRNYADLEKKYAPKETELKALNGEIESLTKQLQAQGDKLSDAERSSRAKVIDEKRKKLDRSAEDMKNDGNREIQEMYSSLASKVYDVLASYAQQQGYSIVLDMGQQQTPVLFVAPTTDITKAVIAAYNTKSGVAAPPAQPGAAAPKAPASR